MAHKYSGGCAHVPTHSDADPVDNHTCHCSVCKRVTGQPTTHVVFFRHGDLEVENPGGLNRVPHVEQTQSSSGPFGFSLLNGTRSRPPGFSTSRSPCRKNTTCVVG